MSSVYDSLGRPLRDLRISVTDRCNFRCGYCMPAEIFGSGYSFLPKAEILSFEEITRVVKIFAELGVKKVRLTGGEPLLRRDLPRLVQMLAKVPALEELALTTNGTLLPQLAEPLAKGGLQRVTVSLDALDKDIFRRMSGDVTSPEHVTAGIETALDAGLGVKINMVVQRGINENQILPIAEYGRNLGVTTRFIEFMDVGNHNGWVRDKVFTAHEILDVLRGNFNLKPVESAYRGEVAQRFHESDNIWEVGIIASVTQPFCQDCGRARITADGNLYTCLFATKGLDLKKSLRSGSSDKFLCRTISSLWSVRSDRYSETRLEREMHPNKVEMHYVGG